MNDIEPTRVSGIGDWVIGVLCFFIGCIGVIAYTFSKTTPMSVASPTTAPAEETPFSRAPPARSLKGLLTVKIGDVQKYSRGGTGFQESTQSAEVLIGESIFTKHEATATVEIPQLATLSIQENSEILFANLFPENSVFLHKTGKIFYSVESSSPVAVRALHTLISASSSAFLVEVNDGNTTVTAQSGIVKLALVDRNNETHVWELEGGDMAKINDETRKVSFILPR